MNIKNLFENFETYAKLNDNSALPIYSFPLSNKEKDEMKKFPVTYEYRFIADAEKKKVYIFRGFLHQTAVLYLKYDKEYNYKDYNDKRPVLFGDCSLRLDGKFSYVGSMKTEISINKPSAYKNYLKIIAKADWDFVEQYISGVKEEIKKIRTKVKSLNEEFHKYGSPNKIVKKEYPIFRFPLKEKEIKEITNNVYHTVRFLADNKTKIIYVWHVYAALHKFAANELGIAQYPKFDESDTYTKSTQEFVARYLPGTATYENGQFVFDGSDYYHFLGKKKTTGNLAKYINKDWRWVDKYIKNTSVGAMNENFQETKSSAFRSLVDRYINRLSEEYETSLKYDREYPIFSFPLSSKEKRELLEQNKHTKFPNEFRLIILNKKKKIYIFSPEVLHQQADKVLNINKYFINKPDNFKNSEVIYGFAHYEGGHFIIIKDLPDGYEWVNKFLKVM
jgi:hypothetical protein